MFAVFERHSSCNSVTTTTTTTTTTETTTTTTSFICMAIKERRLQHCKSILSNGTCKKSSTTRQGMQQGANFCTTLLLLYRTSDWLNQQNLPKLQVAVYLSFIFNWSTIFLSTKSLLNLNTTVILCGVYWKIGSFYCLCLRLLQLVQMFSHKGNYLSK